MERRLIEGFLDYLVEKAASPNTVSAYRGDLLQFDQFIGGLGCRQVRAKYLAGFMIQLQNSNYATSSIARKVAVIKSFFAYLADDNFISTNPVVKVIPPKVVPGKPTHLGPDEVERLLGFLAGLRTPEAKRDNAMLLILFSTGVRISDLLAVNIDVVSQDCSALLIAEIWQDLRTEVSDSLRFYNQEVRPKLVGKRDESALFVNCHGRRLTRQGVWLLLKNYGRAARIPTLVTPRVLRSTFAINCLSSGMRLQEVGERLGHASDTSTRRYVTRAIA